MRVEIIVYMDEAANGAGVDFCESRLRVSPAKASVFLISGTDVVCRCLIKMSTMHGEWTHHDHTASELPGS